MMVNHLSKNIGRHNAEKEETDIKAKELHQSLDSFEKSIDCSCEIVFKEHLESANPILVNLEYYPPQQPCVKPIESFSKLSEQELCNGCIIYPQCKPIEVEEYSEIIFDVNEEPIGYLLTESMKLLKEKIKILPLNEVKIEKIVAERDRESNIELLSLENKLMNWKIDWLALNSIVEQFLSSCTISYEHYRRLLNISNRKHIVQYDLECKEGLESEQKFNFLDVGNKIDYISEEYYSKFCSWCISDKAEYYCKYECNNLFQVCYSTLDYIAIHGLSLKKCAIDDCSRYFVPEKNLNEIYCCDKCKKKAKAIQKQIQRDKMSRIDKLHKNIVDLLDKRLNVQHFYGDISFEEKCRIEDHFKNGYKSTYLNFIAGTITEPEFYLWLTQYRQKLENELINKRGMIKSKKKV